MTYFNTFNQRLDPTMIAKPVFRSRAAALTPFGLLLVCLPTLLVSATVLWALFAGGEGTLTSAADTLRYAQYPRALALHAVAGMAMLGLGIVQITPALRRRFPRWHRWSGRLLVLGGFGFALTGLVMNANAAAPAGTFAYDVAQTLAALGLMACLTAGVVAIRRRAVARHRAWMLRAYAISMGAATQTIALLPVFLLIGPPTGLISNLVLIGAWPFNLCIAEWVIRRGQTS